MPDRSESEPVPAGTVIEGRSQRASRIIARDLSRAAVRKNGSWYQVGTTLEREDLSPREARQLLELDGHVVHWRLPYIQSIRRTARTVLQADVPDVEASRCPFFFAKHLMRHVRTGVVSEEEASGLVCRRSKHIGPPQNMPFREVSSKEGVRDLLNYFEEDSHNAQPTQE